MFGLIEDSGFVSGPDRSYHISEDIDRWIYCHSDGLLLLALALVVLGSVVMPLTGAMIFRNKE